MTREGKESHGDQLTRFPLPLANERGGIKNHIPGSSRSVISLRTGFGSVPTDDGGGGQGEAENEAHSPIPPHAPMTRLGTYGTRSRPLKKYSACLVSPSHGPGGICGGDYGEVRQTTCITSFAKFATSSPALLSMYTSATGLPTTILS